MLTRTSREPFNTLYNSFTKAGSKTYLHGGAKSNANKQVQAWFKKVSVKLLPLPTNNPDVNPLEKIWSEIDKKLAKIKICSICGSSVVLVITLQDVLFEDRRSHQSSRRSH